jgi:hypothetical protein
MADPRLVQSAAQSIERLRGEIDRYHQARETSRTAITNPTLKPQQQEELAKHVESIRDSATEQRAAGEYRGLLGLLRSREPTIEEIHLGLPPTEALGALGALSDGNLASVVTQAQTLSSLYQYLSSAESRVAEFLGLATAQGGSSNWWHYAKRAAQLAAVGGLGYAGYRWYKGRKERLPMPGQDGMPDVDVPEEDDEDLDDE